jgi:tRNA (adenine57-N1/adenine58-N1)-methyltransferase catalytic subunit
LTKESLSFSNSDIIEEGKRVLLYLDPRRTWLVQASKDSLPFHTHAGIVQLSSIVGKRYGESVVTTLGQRVFILRPVALDFIMKSERRTQIVYPKDFSYIVARSGIRNGSRVIECGTGSGALTTYFASIIAPDGLVHTFEAREDFSVIAQKNVAKAGLASYVRFENSSLLNSPEGLRENFYDLALLDTGDPWELLNVAHRVLKGSGFVFCICPTTNQLERVVETMKDRMFCDVESVEIMLRHIEARTGKTRPSMRMIGHTCYIASGRKIIHEDGEASYSLGTIENIKSS